MRARETSALFRKLQLQRETENKAQVVTISLWIDSPLRFYTRKKTRGEGMAYLGIMKD